MMKNKKHIRFFEEISISDIAIVGGKNASLGEMFVELRPLGIAVPNGFAVHADAYRSFLKSNKIDTKLNEILARLDEKEYSNLNTISEEARTLILNSSFPDEIIAEIRDAYDELSKICSKDLLDVAVRSSATAEDLPTASFAGQMESYLNISGADQLIQACHLCYASLFTSRAIKYRQDMGFAGLDIALSVGVQQMVRSDKASSGVAFTIDPDSGFKNVIVIDSIWGLGENIVQGRSTPDEWLVFKPALESKMSYPIIRKQCGKKEFTMIYADKAKNLHAAKTIVNQTTSTDLQKDFSLTDSEVIKLADWCLKIENHYGKAMDIEWAKDGDDAQLYIVQARPETVHKKRNRNQKEIYTLKETSKVLASGIALGDKIARGKARILNSPKDGEKLITGEILVTDITNPDWDPVLKRAAGIITNKGGRTSHAAIIAREMGTVAIVGCGNATQMIQDGMEITVSCAEGKDGHIYEGLLEFKTEALDLGGIEMPKTAPMFILADPDRAFELSEYPNKGVGLLRLEFAISNSIRIHPLALCEPEKIINEEIRSEIEVITKGYDDGREYFIDKLAESVAIVAASFYPKEVIVRMSDFKSNEYANLIGGKYFEPHEENPMLGLRGASRYYSDLYRKGFELECRAMKKVREEMGLNNVKLMIPFCRTVPEAEKVLSEMESHGLKRAENGLEIYVMVEIPSNVLLADEFAKLFDGFSIGSNDLTQLTLGLDRDSALVSELFNEENPAVKQLISETIKAAKRNKIKVGLCGQAPSDIPAFAKFLVEEGIDSISFNPDALFKGIENMNQAEKLK